MSEQVKAGQVYIDAAGRERCVTAVEDANVWWRYVGKTKTYGPKFAPHWRYENRLKGTPEADARLAKLLPDPRDAVVAAARKHVAEWNGHPALNEIMAALTALDAAKAASPK